VRVLRPPPPHNFDTNPKAQYNVWDDARRHKCLAVLHAGNGRNFKRALGRGILRPAGEREYVKKAAAQALDGARREVLQAFFGRDESDGQGARVSSGVRPSLGYHTLSVVFAR